MRAIVFCFNVACSMLSVSEGDRRKRRVGDGREKGRRGGTLLFLYQTPLVFRSVIRQSSRLDFRRSLVSGQRPSPRRTFGGGARAPFPNSGWSSILFPPLSRISWEDEGRGGAFPEQGLGIDSNNVPSVYLTFAHLEKFRLNFSSSSFVICVDLLHP